MSNNLLQYPRSWLLCYIAFSNFCHYWTYPIIKTESPVWWKPQKLKLGINEKLSWLIFQGCLSRRTNSTCVNTVKMTVIVRLIHEYLLQHSRMKWMNWFSQVYLKKDKNVYGNIWNIKQIYYVDLHAGNSETLAGNDSSSPQTWCHRCLKSPIPCCILKLPAELLLPCLHCQAT